MARYCASIMIPLLLFLLLILPRCIEGIELTFELPDNANQCFYEEVKSGVDCVIEFQVVTGGQYDVDVALENPTGEVLYKERRKQMDSFTYKTTMPGAYKVCFSNEFSTFSHKVVYMDWQTGKETDNLSRPPSRITPMSQLETSAMNIADRLRIVDDYQTHHRLREATGRKNAEELNERVLLWSLGQTTVIILIAIGQVVGMLEMISNTFRNFNSSINRHITSLRCFSFAHSSLTSDQYMASRIRKTLREDRSSSNTLAYCEFVSLDSGLNNVMYCLEERLLHKEICEFIQHCPSECVDSGLMQFWNSFVSYP